MDVEPIYVSKESYMTFFIYVSTSEQALTSLRNFFMSAFWLFPNFGDFFDFVDCKYKVENKECYSHYNTG